MTDLKLAVADVRTLETPAVLVFARPGADIPGLVSADLLASVGFAGAAGELARVPARAVDGPFAGGMLAVAGLGEANGPAALRRAAGAG
ncbi:MAG: hypothetical protein LBL01_06005, partial [Bifidobacteriaceae bacterium]|nr:hypothetical protein [Bifidobacteriaceae bacterium]